MAEAEGDKTLNLSEQYHLKGNEEKANVGINPEEVKEVQNPENAASKELVADKAEETPAAAAAAVASEESSGSTPTAVGEESTEDNTGAAENSSEAGTEESSENTENSGEQEAEEETPEVKLETAPADFRFPTTNQTRHCFTRYVEYHRCVAAKGEGAPECEKFAKYYRSLCPGEWVERWNEQRENGTFPGPL